MMVLSKHSKPGADAPIFRMIEDAPAGIKRAYVICHAIQRVDTERPINEREKLQLQHMLAVQVNMNRAELRLV